MGNATRKKVNKQSWYRFICVIFFLITIIQPLSIIYRDREVFFSRGYISQYELFKRAYEGSQYVQKKNPGIMPDQTLESFAGGAFLKGVNPILIIHDQPPLGRYMISLSILLFDNTSTIMVLLLFFSGLGVFLVARLVFNNILLSLIPLGIFLNEPLFINKFYNSPLLEPIQLPFIIFSLYFFAQGIIKKNYTKWFILTSIMLGFVISIRFFVLGAVLVSAMILYFLIKKQINKKFVIFLLTLPIALIVLFTSYTRTIQLGSSIVHILGIQRYIYNYHKLQLSLPFSFWDLILFNRWHTWWGTKGITSDPQWIIIWPISMILTLIYFLAGIFKKVPVSEPEKILIIWIIAYSLFLSLGQTSTRYFPPLLPFAYIITISFLKKTYEKIFF
ncbi:MAG: glycosyltransferase family 39 protein [bacterium]|nr:glycosyltransferase family 39 protein [bacterium]